MKKNIPVCPVPAEQKPLNEYNTLKNSSDFTWTRAPQFEFNRSILLLMSGFSFLWGILLCSNSTDDMYLNIRLLLTSVFTNTSVLFILIRYYLGWSYVYSRLMQATIAYEESGWYDGQIWIKPPEMVLQDRLVGIYELRPILSRLLKGISFFTFMISFQIILFKLFIK